jgi:hypothetical protein
MKTKEEVHTTDEIEGIMQKEVREYYYYYYYYNYYYLKKLFVLNNFDKVQMTYNFYHNIDLEVIDIEYYFDCCVVQICCGAVIL